MTPTTDRQRATWFRPVYAGQDLRVSDAERAEVTDRLARHYGDGRLDLAEFDERVSRAMAAKTAADFRGLLDDLPGDASNGTAKAPRTPPPGLGHPAARRPRGPRRGPVRTLLLIVLAVIAASIAWHVVAGWVTPLVWLALIGAVIVLAVRRARRTRN
jgi:Domain of unknown function (DUF1707)